MEGNPTLDSVINIYKKKGKESVQYKVIKWCIFRKHGVWSNIGFVIKLKREERIHSILSIQMVRINLNYLTTVELYTHISKEPGLKSLCNFGGTTDFFL